MSLDESTKGWMYCSSLLDRSISVPSSAVAAPSTGCSSVIGCVAASDLISSDGTE